MRSDVAVKVFGDDMDTLNETAEQISKVLEAVPGAEDVKVEQTTGLPMLSVQIDREKAARLGLNVATSGHAGTALGGREAGAVFEGDRRFDILVRLPEACAVTSMPWGSCPSACPLECVGRACCFARLGDVGPRWT